MTEPEWRADDTETMLSHLRTAHPAALTPEEIGECWSNCEACMGIRDLGTQHANSDYTRIAPKDEELQTAAAWWEEFITPISSYEAQRAHPLFWAAIENGRHMYYTWGDPTLLKEQVAEYFLKEMAAQQ